MQTFDARAFRGKRVRFSAALRVEGPPDDSKSRAQLWLRGDRPNGAEPALFDNMYDRPIRSPDWARYEVAATAQWRVATKVTKTTTDGYHPRCRNVVACVRM